MVESIVTVGLEVVKCLAPPTERQISYLRNYKNNFENLKNEIEKLKNDRESVQHKVDEAKGNGEEIEKKVQEWLAGVNKIITEAEKFLVDEDTENNRCFKGLCPNLKTRHRLSKEAVRLKEAIVKHLDAGIFDRISYRITPEDIWLMPNKEYEAFKSRMSTLKKILGALNDPDVNMVGIYGMGGIGKTTLAKEVARHAKTDEHFEQVVFSELSQGQDRIRKIQGEIADKLCLKFPEESESGRARRLYDRLKKEKKILLVLDNVWENLDLQAVGIPHGDYHKGCKILLTARSEDTLLRKMDSQQNFRVGVLNEEEAWSLFKKMAGDYIEGSQFKPVATDVAKECAGLPVSIVAVARALRNKRLFEWDDALQQLRKPSTRNFKDIQAAAYSTIELSYNKLEGEELKKIFLLIGYTDLRYINDLLIYSMGLDLFQGIDKMEEARAPVRTLVQKLKASCMLLDNNNGGEDWFSMHDVVRDVAVSIASTEQNVLMVTDELGNRRGWLSGSTIKHQYSSIVLPGVKTDVLVEVFECPQLKFFLIYGVGNSLLLTIPDDLFTRMIQVRVIDFSNMHLLSLPSSLVLLINLRTLCLCECKLPDISIIGDLKNLEILCLYGSDIRELPVKVGQLALLRLLDLRYCSELEVIPPNVLSKLSHLEELYIGENSFNKWEEEVEGVKNASVEELKHLPNLTSLELHIKDVNTLSRGLFFEKLVRYRILIGENSREKTKSCRTFMLNGNICFKDGIIVQLQGIEYLSLAGLQEQYIKYFFHELVTVGPSQLKHLCVAGLTNSKRSEESTTKMRLNEIIFEGDALFVEKVALPNLETLSIHSMCVERIWQSQLAAMSCGIQNLTRLSVCDCRNLRCLFSSSVASSFVRLQNLKIEKCPVLEGIIVMDHQERENVMFPQLEYLEMKDLEKLKDFCTGDLHILFPSLKELNIEECPQFIDLTKVVSLLPNLEGLSVDAKHMPRICQFPEDFFHKLISLGVMLDESNSILSVDDFFQRFHIMKMLIIYGGKGSTQFLNEKAENGMRIIIREVNKFCGLKHILKPSAIIDNLETLEFLDLECDNLINLVPSSTTFQNLKTLEAWRCNGLIKLLTSSTAKSLVRLTHMYINECNMITEIVAKDDDGDAAKDEIIFRDLKELELCFLESLTSFCSGNCAFKFRSLERLLVVECPKMNIFSGGELSTPNLHKVHKVFYRESDWTWNGDLNTTIRQLYQETIEAEKEDNDESTKENNADGNVSEISEEDF